MGRLDVLERLADDREGAQAQEVHLEQAHVRDRVALVLGDRDVALGVELRGHVVGDGSGSDERRAGMDALAAGHALYREGRVNDAVGDLVVLVGLLEVGRILVGLPLALVQGVRKLEARVPGEHLGEPLAHVDGLAEHARRVVDGLLGLDRGVGDDLADVILAVELADVGEDLLEVLVVEVHVYVGHLRALGREEALEHEAILKRVEARDVHGVGDDGTCRRATPRPHANAPVLGPLDVVLDDEEVVGKALVADDPVLVLKALLDVDATDDDVSPVGAVALGKAALALDAKALLGGLAGLEPWELGQVHARPVQLEVTLGRDLEGVVAGLGYPGEELAHLLLTLHVEL